MVSKPSAAAASSLWGRVVRTLSRATQKEVTPAKSLPVALVVDET